ncbi:ATP-binding protein [Methanoculleus sp. MH98A]|uniref:ATP-binding protein n=1 Tax=Methanoculleus sp. MH98A TaxID=1495314 RepID=UPI0018CC61E4|nr:ATP-binding protein [Methanoculleus sp. MH98A]
MMSNNPSEPLKNLAIGTIIEVSGTHIVAELDPLIHNLSRIFAGEIYPIGQFGSILKIHFGRRIIYAFVSKLRMKSEYELENGIISTFASNARVIEADLFGEGEWIQSDEQWKLVFERGVSTFPLPKQVVYLTPKSELKWLFDKGSRATIPIGDHVGVDGAICYVDMNELLGKHTAILGSTGSGKSGTVAALLHAIIEHGEDNQYQNWKPKIVVLDPHNEYGSAFPTHKRLSTDEGSLKLPYWLFNLQETISLFLGKTEFTATTQSNIIKVALLEARKEAAELTDLPPDTVTVDAPIPYSLERFKAEVNKQKPSGNDQRKLEPYNSVIGKLEVLERDERMKFMMESWDGSGDPLPSVISQFLGSEDPISIVDLSGVPNEIAGLASAVIARTLFSLKIWQTSDERARTPILLVCEEAHRYVPNRGEAQYEAAQDGIRRLAKEGRKYGIALMLVSQRPSEIDPTVLSQCSTWIVLRITNENDRAQVNAILPDSLAGLTNVLSGLRRREAICVGQAITLPSRIRVTELTPERLPRSHDVDFDAGWQLDSPNEADFKNIAQRWRQQIRLK